MVTTVRCPDCQAELALPSSAEEPRVQCPRCRRVFNASHPTATAVTAAPAKKPSAHSTEDHELYEEGKYVGALRAPVAMWFGIVPRLAIAVSVGALAMPASYIAYDEVRHRLLRREIHVPAQLLAEYSFSWIQISLWPAILAFAVWIALTSRNVPLLAAEMKASGARAIAVIILTVLSGIFLWVIWAQLGHGDGSRRFFTVLLVHVSIHFVAIIVAFFALQQLWRASDPDEIRQTDSWQKVAANRWIHLWAVLCVLAPLMIVAAFLLDSFGKRQLVDGLILLAPCFLAAAGVVLIAIIRSIDLRLRERYRRLCDDL